MGIVLCIVSYIRYIFAWELHAAFIYNVILL